MARSGACLDLVRGSVRCASPSGAQLYAARSGAWLALVRGWVMAGSGAWLGPARGSVWCAARSVRGTATRSDGTLPPRRDVTPLALARAATPRWTLSAPASSDVASSSCQVADQVEYCDTSGANAFSWSPICEGGQGVTWDELTGVQ